jgi:hypothetical protein
LSREPGWSQVSAYLHDLWHLLKLSERFTTPSEPVQSHYAPFAFLLFLLFSCKGTV